MKTKQSILSYMAASLVAAAMISVTTPASATDQVPFRGSFTTTFQTVLQFPFLYITVEGQGNVSHMGLTSAFTDNQVANLISGSTTATYTLTAANGDTVVLEMSFQGTQVPGGFTFAGDYTVTGGHRPVLWGNRRRCAGRIGILHRTDQRRGVVFCGRHNLAAGPSLNRVEPDCGLVFNNQ